MFSHTDAKPIPRLCTRQFVVYIRHSVTYYTPHAMKTCCNPLIHMPLFHLLLTDKSKNRSLNHEEIHNQVYLSALEIPTNRNHYTAIICSFIHPFFEARSRCLSARSCNARPISSFCAKHNISSSNCKAYSTRR